MVVVAVVVLLVSVVIVEMVVAVLVVVFGSGRGVVVAVKVSVQVPLEVNKPLLSGRKGPWVGGRSMGRRGEGGGDAFTQRGIQCETKEQGNGKELPKTIFSIAR